MPAGAAASGLACAAGPAPASGQSCAALSDDAHSVGRCQADGRRQIGRSAPCTDAAIRRSASRACAGLATHRARDLVERGEYFLRQPLLAASLHAARARFDDALRESPHSASACVGLARAWLNLATGWYHDPALAGEHAAEALQQALAIDPMLPMAHALMGVLQNQWQRDWPAAQRSFRRAVALAPDAAFVRAAWGSHLFMRGRLDEVEAELQIARQLDLGRAVDEGDPSVLLTPMDSCLAPLRGNPAFDRLCLALRHKRCAPAVRPANPAPGAAAKPAAPRRPPGPAAASPARARRPARRS